VDFISKPIEESEVLARVKTHLQLRTMQLHLEEMVTKRTIALTAANQSIRESEAKYRNLVEQAEDGIAVVQDEKIVFANRSFAEITGRTFVAIPNTPFTEYISADDVPKITDLYQRRLDEEPPPISETTIQHKDGSQVEVEFNAGLTIFDGKPSVQVIIRDITERKQAEAAIQASEEQFRQLVEQSPMSIQIVSPEGQITKVNRAFMKLWGISEDDLPEVLAKYNLLEDEEAKKKGVMPLINKAFKGEAVVLPAIEYDADSTMDTIGVETKANKRWIQARLYPVKNAHGEMVSVIHIEEDISERIQAEQQIQYHQDRLKALASQLTIAEERERRRIASDLHDEVGQTLAFARMRLASAHKTTADPKLLAILDEVSESLRNAIEDTEVLVFDLSSPLLYEVGLGAAISEWLEQQLQNVYDLEFSFSEEGPKTALNEDIDAILFRNVRELLTNVIRHASASQVSVHIERAEDIITVIIEDDGVGFDPDAIAQKRGRGAGFGLFSIQERMSDLGGTFEIQSAPGRGSKAILSIPLAN
jgi:PAS domain S-box-containing protein